MIPTRSLGKLTVSALGLGCMGMSEFYGKGDERESLSVFARARELGITLLDTADMYGPFTNEELVGRAIKGHRDAFVVATKCGIVRDPNDPSRRGVNGKPDYIKASCEGSLKRLGVDVIDLYQLHRLDPATPIEESVHALGSLVTEGKVRAIGLSEVSAETLARAHAVFPITSVQTEYSLFSREPEDSVLATCKRLGIGFLAYSPLGRGFLTGQIKRFEDFEPGDFRRNLPRFQGESFEKNLALVRAIEALAAARRVSVSELALAWVLSRGDFIVPIPGTKRIRYLEENARAADLTLTTEELAAIERAMPRDAVAGERYAPAGMKTLDR